MLEPKQSVTLSWSTLWFELEHAVPERKCLTGSSFVMTVLARVPKSGTTPVFDQPQFEHHRKSNIIASGTQESNASLDTPRQATCSTWTCTIFERGSLEMQEGDVHFRS